MATEEEELFGTAGSFSFEKFSFLLPKRLLQLGHSCVPKINPQDQFHPLLQLPVCCGTFVHCVKMYCCIWCNKKLNDQQLGRRYRQDFWAERELWEEERWSLQPDMEEKDGQHEVTNETRMKSDIRYRAEVTEPHGRR